MPAVAALRSWPRRRRHLERDRRQAHAGLPVPAPADGRRRAGDVLDVLNVLLTRDWLC